MEANGSILTNKVTEGLPNARHHGGNKYIDELEVICRKRALEAFHLDPAKWGVNVQPYSGSTANFIALTALLQPHERFMGLGLPDGGHFSHGYYTAKRKLTASSIYFESFPYGLDPATELVDYEGLAKHARMLKPRLIICGASAYTRDWDYSALRKVADEHNTSLMADIAHTSGLIAAHALVNPFDYCDIVTTTTNKMLRGPQAGMIFFHRDSKNHGDLEKRVNDAVFPGFQGSSHNNTIAAVATALLQVSQPSWKNYAQQVIKNARALADELLKYGYKLQTGGTDNHIVLWDLRPLGLTSSKVDKICELLGITINKNTVSGDVSVQAPGGIRLGTASLTSRNMMEFDVRVIASFLHRSVQLALLLQEEAGSNLLKDFLKVATTESEGKDGARLMRELRREVREFVRRWPMPGVEGEMKRPAGVEEDD